MKKESNEFGCALMILAFFIGLALVIFATK